MRHHCYSWETKETFSSIGPNLGTQNMYTYTVLGGPFRAPQTLIDVGWPPAPHEHGRGTECTKTRRHGPNRTEQEPGRPQTDAKKIYWRPFPGASKTEVFLSFYFLFVLRFSYFLGQAPTPKIRKFLTQNKIQVS